MSEGRGRLEWNQTSAVLAQIHNANCEKGQAIQPDDLNPYVAKKKQPVQAGGNVVRMPLSVLAHAMAPKHKV